MGTPLPRCLPHGILGNVAKHYGIWVPSPPGVDKLTKWNYYLPVVLRTRAVNIALSRVPQRILSQNLILSVVLKGDTALHGEVLVQSCFSLLVRHDRLPFVNLKANINYPSVSFYHGSSIEYFNYLLSVGLKSIWCTCNTFNSRFLHWQWNWKCSLSFDTLMTFWILIQ